ncbi:aspartate/glutamate racemase family protein [Arthrobacter bambusae]|uniref:aspartate/glutamate racemase family protein n=1 Tax=Arthrobacter bambusae TaxID=1338426 RepID=UPI002782FA7C|nr:aspartate/glutamate racemase family protein [Arthrobacter bambusae]MDQ0239534.1 allantoin racemase [Arthrobacter bambusae]
MRVLIVNCNTSAAMTSEIVAAARSAARPGTEILGTEPLWGPASAEGFYESFVTAAAVLDRLATWPVGDPVDAVVMAGFGEHGREGARQLLSVPVVDITEAAVQMACLLGHKYGIVTTMPQAVAPIEGSIAAAGLSGRCVGVQSADVAVLAVRADASATARTLAEQARILMLDGADVIVLGCAGFGGMDKELERELGVPVVDGVAAAVALSESLVHLGKSTSKLGPYRPINKSKQMRGWPVSAVTASDAIQEGSVHA